MKRKLEDSNYPAPKRLSLTLYNSIRTNFYQLNSEHLQSLIEQLKDGMTFEDTAYLLKLLAHKINKVGMASLKEYKEPLNQLAKLAFENIKKCFATSDSAFKNWASYGEAENMISFLIYDLGIIAAEFEVPILEAKHLQFILNALFEITHESFFFGRAFYGLGLLAKQTAGQYNVQLLENIIDQVSTSKTPISPVVVENLTRGLSYLSQEKKLTDRIVSKLLNKLLYILCDTKIERYHSISLIFNSLKIICTRDYLEGNLDSLPLQNLVTQLAGFKNLPNSAIKPIFSLLEKLAHFEQIDGHFDLNCLELLLQKYSLESKRVEVGDIYFSLGKLIHAQKVKGKLSNQLVANLANCFDFKKAPAYQIANFIFGYTLLIKELAMKPDTKLLDALLSEFISLKRQATSVDGKFLIEGLASLQMTISWGKLESCVELAMNQSFLDPLYAAELYLSLKQFKNHSQLLQPYFTVLENAITPHKHKLPAKISEELVRVSKPDTPQKNSPLLARAIKKIPSPTQSPSLARLKIFKNQPTQTLLQKQLVQANKNEIYKTIAEQNIQKLLKILNLSATVLNETLHAAHNENHATSHSKSSGKREYSAIEKLIIDFFKHTGHAAFQHLLKNSKSSYFYCLFKACSLPVLYELAKSHELHSLMINLPLGELKKLIPKLISPLQFYRDHHSLLNLIDGLTLRGDKKPEERKDLKILKNELMEKGIDFHSRSKHIHVEHSLKSCVAKMNNGYLIYPDNQFYKRTFMTSEEESSNSTPSLANKLATRGIFAHSAEKARPQVANPGLS